MLDRARSTVTPTRARGAGGRYRALAITVALVLWMLLIAARLIYLQTSQYGWLKERARAQQQNLSETHPQRGLIVDRRGQEVARSVLAKSFFAVPHEIQSADETAARLAEVLGADAGLLTARLHKARMARQQFMWLARKLSPDQAAKVTSLNLPGVYALEEPKRYYPKGQLAAHVLGFVSLDEAGLAGVEQFYDVALRGAAGKILVEQDGQRQPFRSFETEARSGQTVVLTIDGTIQHHTERALAAAVRRTRARSGTAIVLDPRTGEILALANWPAFDPNHAHNSAPEALTNDALQNIYEPGSTFKIVAYAAAIERKLAAPSDSIDCQMGSIRVGERAIHDAHPYGVLTLTEALAKSSNVAAIKLAERVGPASLYEYIKRFGFGSATGVELPGETVGLLRPVARWQPSSIGAIAIGQEIGVTPLQMAAAFGALANNGIRKGPHLVREVRASGDANLVVRRTEATEQRVVSAETAGVMRRMLENVTLKGTAQRAQLDGYSGAGKTGTAQKIDPRTKSYSKTKYVASFVGFAPVERPAAVIAVVIDEPAGKYHGGDVAAPVFREIAERTLPALNVQPHIQPGLAPENGTLIARAASAAPSQVGGRESPHRNPPAKGQPATLPQTIRRGDEEVIYTRAAGHALLMPNLVGQSVRDAARVCAGLGLQLEARGTGRALKQHPAAGTSIESGQLVRVSFSRSD